MSFYIKLETKDRDEIILDTLKSYYEVDKFAMNFKSSYDLINSLNNAEHIDTIRIYNGDKRTRVSSSRAKVLISIFDNKKVNGLLDSIHSSLFTEPTNEHNIEVFKDYLRQEKLRFSKKDSYSNQLRAIINETYKLLNYGNIEKEKDRLRKLLKSLVDIDNYYEVRYLYNSLTDLDFYFDDSFSKLYRENKKEVNKEEKQKTIDDFNKKIDKHFNEKKQITFDDLDMQEVNDDNPVFNMNGEKIDEIPFYKETEEKKKALNLRG